MRAFVFPCALAATLSIAVAHPRQAAAFCRSTTCSDADCPRDQNFCKTSGQKLFWASSCTSFSIQKDGTVNLPMADVRPVIEASFVTWSDLSCKGGEADIAFAELGDAACHHADFDKSGPNANVVMFQDAKWRYTGVDDTLAKTTVSFDTETGEIWDADIELNYAYNQITIGDDPVVYDLSSILTHEIGHFIGLDHSLDDEATMNAEYDIGTTFHRTLAPDDIAGACAIYPPSRHAHCSTTPRGGFSGACSDGDGGGGSSDGGGCSTSGAPAKGPTTSAALMLLAGAASRFRRRRRGPRRGAVAATLFAGLVALAAAACGGDSPAETLCDAGSVVFCRCPDGEAGSKTCDEEGKAFGACKLQSTGGVCPDHLPTGTGGGTSSSGGGGASSSSSGAGASGGSGGSGGGGGGPVGACPGTPLTIGFGSDKTVGGDTTVGMDGQSDRCGGDGAPEIAYQVTPSGSGTLVVTASGIDQTDPVLYARTGDCATGVSLGCSDQTTAGGTEVLTLEAVSGTPLWVFVDGFGSSAGSYSLTLHLANGVPGDTCPGIDIAIDPGDVITAGGDTSIAAPNYKGAGTCGVSGTKEIVYGVTPSADGTLTVTLDPSFDAQLYAREGSCTSSTSGTQLGCSDTPGSGMAESVTFAVVAGTRYSVFADGAAGEAGPYTISFDLE